MRHLPAIEVLLLHELFHNKPLRVPKEVEMLSASFEGHTPHYRRSISQTCASLALLP